MTDQIDPYTIARFMVLPGATRLVHAFSAIPPGRLRESVLAHAEAIAAEYVTSSGEVGMPDPLLMAHQQTMAQPEALSRAVSGPRKGQLTADSWEARAVGMRLEGDPPWKIAEALGKPLKEVNACMKHAERQGGIVFPAAPRGRKKGGKAKRPVEDRAFALDLEGLSQLQIASLVRGAKKRGLGLEAYMAARREVVTLAKGGAQRSEITRKTGIPEENVSLWLNAARAAGHAIPYFQPPALVEELAPPAPPPGPARKTNLNFWLDHRAIPPQSKQVAAEAAARLNTDLPGYAAIRRKALGLFQRGLSPGTVAAQLGLGQKQAENWREAMKAAGHLSVTAA